MSRIHHAKHPKLRVIITKYSSFLDEIDYIYANAELSVLDLVSYLKVFLSVYSIIKYGLSGTLLNIHSYELLLPNSNFLGSLSLSLSPKNSSPASIILTTLDQCQLNIRPTRYAVALRSLFFIRIPIMGK
jgi:hypothetical protein